MLDFPAPDSPSRATDRPAISSLEHLDADALLDRRDHDGHVGVAGSHLGHGLLGVDGAGPVRLGQHHHGLGAGIVGDGGAALDAAVLHRAVEPAHEQEAVDVGGELLLSAAVGGAAAQQRATGEDGDHLVVDEGDPVADGGLGVEPDGEHHGAGPVVEGEHQAGAVVLQHPCRPGVGCHLGQRRSPSVVPPERAQGGVGVAHRRQCPGTSPVAGRGVRGSSPWLPGASRGSP